MISLMLYNKQNLGCINVLETSKKGKGKSKKKKKNPPPPRKRIKRQKEQTVEIGDQEQF